MQRAELAELQARLGRALVAPDPVAAFRALLPDQPCDADGLRVAALLVAKLRFQRLTNGSRRALEWFERDPRAFTAAFQRYHHAVVPDALDPWREAELFERWLDDDAAT